MMLTMYTIKDEHNGHACPIPLPNDEIAKRYLYDQYMENPTVKNSPEDFSIWNVGNFESETGRMIPDEPKLVERAKNYVKE